MAKNPLCLFGTDPDSEVRAGILAGLAFDTFFRINLLNHIGALGIPTFGYHQYFLGAVSDTDTAALADLFFYTNTHITLQSVEESSLFRAMCSLCVLQPLSEPPVY